MKPTSCSFVFTFGCTKWGLERYPKTHFMSSKVCISLMEETESEPNNTPAWQRRRLRYKVTMWLAQATELPCWGQDSLTGGFQRVSCLVNTAWSSSRIVPWRHLPRQDTVSSTKKLLFSFSRHNSTFLSKYTLPRLRASPPGARQHCCLLRPLSHLQSAAARVFSGN